MVNGARGEVAFELDGKSYCLCLTMGALAEIETALGAGSLNDLDAKLKAPRAEDLIAILHALMKGGGETLTREEVLDLPMQVADVSAAIAAAFAAAGTRAPGSQTDPQSGPQT